MATTIRASQYKKKHQTLIRRLFFYFLAALICSLFWCSPFWIPLLSSSVEYLFSPKCLFIVANLIVFRLVGEKKVLFSSPCPLSENHFEEAQRVSFYGDGDEEEVDKGEQGLDGETELFIWPDEELTQRVDDYITRVNELRRIEVKYLH